MRTIDVTTHVEDLLDDLDSNEQPDKPRKKLELVENPSLTAIIADFREKIKPFIGNKVPLLPEKAQLYGILVQDLPRDYSAVDLLAFSLRLAGLMQDYKSKNEEGVLNTIAGLYLSALINHCGEQEITLRLEGEASSLDNIGHRNDGKKIIVHGDVGIELADYMLDGYLEVHGSANAFAGMDLRGGKVVIKKNVRMGAARGMAGGTLIIEGNAYVNFAEYMLGGEVIVHGNVAGGLGHNMAGGIIRLQGDYGKLADVKGGTIYHKDECIVRKGNIL